jgi:Flp pilus assembly protein TadB
MNVNIVLDVIVAGLLVATIAYAILLSRRLGALRNDKQQLEALVSSLDISSQRAEAGIASLKEAAERIGQQLQQRVEQGKALQTDLSYIIDLGGGLADRLEGTIRARRDDIKPSPRSMM